MRCLAHAFNACEAVFVRHLLAADAAEVVEEGLLVWLARFDVVHHHAVQVGQLGKYLAQELRPVIRAQSLQYSWSRLIFSSARGR